MAGRETGDKFRTARPHLAVPAQQKAFPIVFGQTGRGAVFFQLSSRYPAYPFSASHQDASVRLGQYALHRAGIERALRGSKFERRRSPGFAAIGGLGHHHAELSDGEYPPVGGGGQAGIVGNFQALPSISHGHETALVTTEGQTVPRSHPQPAIAVQHQGPNERTGQPLFFSKAPEPGAIVFIQPAFGPDP